MLEKLDMLDRFGGVRGRARSRRGVALAIALVAGVLLGAGSASAIALPVIPGLGTIEPAYFNPKNQVGLAGGYVPDITIPNTIPQIRVCNLASPACTNPDIAVTQTLGTIWQRPQTGGMTPSQAYPYVADVTFTFERITPPPGGYCYDGDDYYEGNGCGQIDPVLVAFAAIVDPYSTDPPAALDFSGLAGAADLLILQRLTGGVDKQFPAYLLPGLDVGETFSIVVRYVIGGAMQPNALNGYDLPSIAMTGFQVPEPATGFLLLGGILSVALGARRRRNRR
jgi:hypothetical protein